MKKSEKCFLKTHPLISAMLTVGTTSICFYFLLPALLPFLIGFILSRFAKPISGFFDNRKIPHTLSAFFGMSTVLITMALIIRFSASALYNAVVDFANSPEIANLFESAFSFLKGISARPLFSDIAERMSSLIDSAFTGMVSAFGGFVSLVPKAVTGAVLAVFSAYCFALDGGRIKNSLLKAIPDRLAPFVSATANGMKSALLSLPRAYVILFFITYSELAVTFLIIGTPHAFIAALAVSVFDILPVFGAGMIIVPYGFYALFSGNTADGIVLLSAFAVITLVRETAEPKILGKKMGLHPLAAAFLMYAGLCFFGVFGMIAAPIIASVTINTAEIYKGVK